MNIRKLALSGSGWMLFQTLSERASQALIFFVVARVLGPDALGVGAMSIAPAVMFQAMIQCMSQAVVRSEVADQKFLSSSFAVCVGAGVVSGLILIIGAPFYAQLLNIGDASFMIQATAIIPILVGMGTVSEGLLIRGFSFRSMAIRRVIGILLGGVGAIVLASQGFGGWAIVMQTIIIAFCTTIVCLAAARWMPRQRPILSEAIEFAKFSLPLSLTAGVNIFNYRIGELIVGAVAGPAAAGTIRIAQSIIDILTSVMLAPISNLLLPILSRMGGDRVRILDAFFFSSAIVMLVSVFATSGLFNGSSLVAVILPGYAWNDVPSALAILSLGLPFVAVLGPTQSLFVALGHPRWILASNVLQMLLTVVLLGVFARFGADGAAAAVVGRLGLAFICTILFICLRVSTKQRKHLTVALSPICSLLVSLLAVWFGKLIGLSHETFAETVLIVSINIAALALASWFFCRPIYSGLIDTLFKRKELESL